MQVLAEILANLKGNEPSFENYESSEHSRQNFEINCFPKKVKNGMGQPTALSFAPFTKWNKDPNFNSQLSYITLNRVPRYQFGRARFVTKTRSLEALEQKKRPKKFK